MPLPCLLNTVDLVIPLLVTSLLTATLALAALLAAAVLLAVGGCALLADAALAGGFNLLPVADCPLLGLSCAPFAAATAAFVLAGALAALPGTPLATLLEGPAPDVPLCVAPWLALKKRVIADCPSADT